ncbi:MAG: ABC-F family ATP-binding cassette domain-containing protein [Bacteroidetes bacterium]|nr:ABC-F family ATP-binding cassette domain-containing protein [Bacteroidota bacterium]
MHYVSAEGITKGFRADVLFQNISFHISEGDKIALVARNGFGKTTLLKILAGKETVDEGKIWVNKDVTVALFEQEPKFDENITVLENIFHYNHPIINAIKEYENAVEAGDEKLLSQALIKMDELNAWGFESNVKQILGKLNIHQLQSAINELSGGQRKRIALAQTLIDIGFEHKHTLLIMDEPTNHLDIDMVEWLEHYLGQQHVTLLLVTHDRYFLDNICEEIWEIDTGNLYTYKGDYQNYLEKKAARIENEQANIDKAKNLYRRELEWMRKQPRARTTKSRSRIDAFAETEQNAKKKIVDEQLQLQIKMSRMGGKVAEMKKVYKSFGDTIILSGFDYTFNKGERVGIIGKNGVGKSTFINILQGLEQPDSGKINIGDTIVFGNFSQQGLAFKEDMRVIEYVKTFAENFPLAKGGSLSAAQFLELFLFTPEKQYTYLSSLSGGEKKRLQLLTVLFRNPNFLILDEPTNDLDLPTLNVLENFLLDYPGCVVIVSHDRYFMDKLVDHLFVFEGNGVIKDFPGNYTQYRLTSVANIQQVATEHKPKQNDNRPSTAIRKLSYKEKREFEQLEKDMPVLETERKTLTEKLSTDISYEEMASISERLLEINSLLDEKELRWLELSEIAG